MRTPKYTNAFKRHLRLMQRRGKDTKSLKDAISLLLVDAILPDAYCDHALSGKFTGSRDLHIEPDWLLIYRKEKAITEKDCLLILEATGTHTDLFK